MSKVWNDESDLILAETVLRHIRENGTSFTGYQEVCKLLEIEDLVECAERWDGNLSKQYTFAIKNASDQYKKKTTTVATITKPKEKLKEWATYREEYIENVNSKAKQILHHAEKMSPIEAIALLTLVELLECFGSHHLELKPQANIGKYRVDFLITYHPLHNEKPLNKIVVECDGHEFHEKTKEQVERDKARERYLIKEGYTVLRYSGTELMKDRYKIWTDLEEMLIPPHMKESFGYGRNGGGE